MTGQELLITTSFRYNSTWIAQAQLIVSIIAVIAAYIIFCKQLKLSKSQWDIIDKQAKLLNDIKYWIKQ